MTDKKEKILNAALELFANDGYNAVSTNKIATQAGVSEGLIFKHFVNKKGLLQAIMDDTERRLNEVLSHIIFETAPKEVIRKVIELPYLTPESSYDFWRLQFKLKWEKEYYNPDKMKPLIDKLTWAFQELQHEAPALEAKLLEQTIESISIGILRDGKEQQMPFRNFLLEKYKV
ncbi:MAG: TetR/AcrR family transcriptional regulator [Bacteroidota bacterium]